MNIRTVFLRWYISRRVPEFCGRLSTREIEPDIGDVRTWTVKKYFSSRLLPTDKSGTLD